MICKCFFPHSLADWISQFLFGNSQPKTIPDR
jgi:hypothetical protein